MKKDITTIFLNSFNAVKNTDNIYTYSYSFDVPPIIVNNKAVLKVANFAPTSFANIHGDAIYSFKIRGIITDNNKFISNDYGYSTILATTFNNSRNLYEENEIVLCKQTINTITLEVECLTNSSLSSYAVTPTAGGSGYIIGQQINFSGGSPSQQASGYISSLTNNAIKEIKITNYGMGYTSVPTCTVGGAGSGAILKPNMISDGSGNYKIGSITIINGGSNYIDNQPIVFNSTGGSGAILTAVAPAGEIIGVNIINAGNGYTTADPDTSTLTLGGSSATIGASTLTGNAITSIAITNAGSGYVNGQYITLTGGTGTTAAIVSIITNNSGAITGFKIINGGNYTVAPTGGTINSIGGSSATFNYAPIIKSGQILKGIYNNINFCISLKIEEEVNE